MNSVPLHPAIVHIPLGLAMLMPVFAAGFAWAIWTRKLNLPAVVALKGLTFLVSQDARPGLDTSAAFAYARLGDVNVQLGQHGEARKHYERALEIFKNGDPDLPLIVETKAALAKLGS